MMNLKSSLKLISFSFLLKSILASNKIRVAKTAYIANKSVLFSLDLNEPKALSSK